MNQRGVGDHVPPRTSGPLSLGPLFDQPTEALTTAREYQRTVDRVTLPATNRAPFQRDSPTSRDAAERQNRVLGVKQAAVLERLRELGSYGATDNELSDWFVAQHGWSIHTARPRRVELRTLGEVVDSGERRKGSTVWVVREQAQGVAS